MDFVENGGIGIDALLCLIDREADMKNYLLKNSKDISKIENHIFFFDRIKKILGELGQEFNNLQPHVAMHRGITSYTTCYEKVGTYFTITNMMGVVVVTLYKKSSEEEWINTEVKNLEGYIEAKNQKITSIVGNEFKNIMINLENERKKLNKKQKEKITNKILEMGDEIKSYKIFNDINDDKNINIPRRE